MKRLRIWVKNLSLLQQFFLIAFLVAMTFIAFFSTAVPRSIDSFVNQQMHEYIHDAQNQFIYNDYQERPNSDQNVLHVVYSKEDNELINSIPEEYVDIIYAISEKVPYVRDVYDGYLEDDAKSIVYSVKNTHNKIIISFVKNDYRNEYRKAVEDSTINTTLFVVVGLYAFLMLWVITLIHPLNQIKIYIERIKNGEKAKLQISRKDEIGEVAEALNDMQEELSNQEKIREEMFQNISHDLKTPIATIKSYSESIKDGIYPYGTLEKSVDVILEHADRLEKKVYSLITFNKLGYLVDDLSEGDNLQMTPIIQKVIMSAIALRKDVEFKTELEDIYFHGEEEPWRIVVENLIENALRYAKSEIFIELNKDGLFIFNDGELMEEERIEKLFKPYEMGNKGKFGLGLSIVKRVTETYGYRVVGENMNNGVIFKIFKPKNKRNKKLKKKDD